MHRTAAANLEASLHHYESVPAGLAQEFVELKLQACIFQYDVCAEMIGIIRNKPTGFAASVAVKGLVLRLFEYDQLMSTTFIPRLIELAKARSVPFDRATVKLLRTKWKSELSRLKSWSSVRNQAAGHYGKDLNTQVALLKKLEVDEVMAVTRAFLSFNMSLLAGLRDAGKGIGRDA